MRKTLFILAGLVIFLPIRISAQGCGNPANVFTFLFQGKKYEIVKELYSWSVASQCAVERGGYLVQINSKAEQDTVYRSILNGARIATNYRLVADGGGIAYVWIGATDKGTEGKWLWDGNNDGSGTQFWSGKGQAGGGGGTAIGGYFNFWGGATANPTDPNRRNEPDDFNNAQDGAAIALAPWPAPSGGLGIAGEWNDISTNNTLYFVVEFDSTSTTNPEELRTQVTVFPNPASDQVRITSAGSYNPLVTIRIYNVLGSIVYEKKDIHSSDYLIPVSDFQSGAYFIHAELEKGQSVRRKFMIR